MGELLRRRGMMLETGEPSPLLFSIKNVAVSAGDSINTGVKPFVSGLGITILLDFTLTSRPSSGNGADFKWIYCGPNVLQAGTRSATTSATTLYYYWFNDNSYMDAGVSITAGARYRICITHWADSNYVYVKHQKDNDTRKNKSTNKTFTASNNILYFGSPNTTNGMPNGTINSAKVYNYPFSADSEEMAEFFA